MKTKTAILLFGFTLLVSGTNAQTFKEQFNTLVKSKDTTGQKQLLEKWEKADSNDAELYVAYFNYYVNKSRQEMIRLDKREPKDGQALMLMDTDSTNKEPAGYMYSEIYYQPDLLKKGFGWINHGIEVYPERLDMRFGKVYMLGQIEDYENFTLEIIKAIEYSAVIKNKWTWADNKPLDNAEKFMLSAIQDYEVQLYDTEDDSLLSNMRRIAEAVLKYYPHHVESLSNLSLTYIIQGEFDKALDPLLKAEKLDPKDYIVLGNIARVYVLKGDTKNAIKYYELVLKHGDEKGKEYARQALEDLKKK